MRRIFGSGYTHWGLACAGALVLVATLWLVLSRPPNTSALESRVLELMQSGRVAEARREAELLLRVSPRSVFGNLSLGSLAENAEDFDTAAAAYQRVIQSDPEQTQAWLGLGRVLLQLDQYRESRLTFERSREHGAAPAEALTGAGQAEIGAGNLAAGVALYRQALLQAPGFLPAMRALGIALAMQPPGTARYQEAESLLRRTLEGRSRDADARFWLAVVQEARGSSEAVVSLQAALAVEPNHRGALRLLSQLLRRKGLIAEAKTLESRLTSLNSVAGESAPVRNGNYPAREPSRSATISASVGEGFYKDISASAGIDFSLGHGGRSPLTILDTAGCGAGFLDYDGDGRLDLLLIAEHRIALYRQTTVGKVTDVTSAMGVAPAPPDGARWMGCATSDFDADGDTDLYLTGYRCSRLLRNEKGKRFTDLTRAAGIENRDGWETSATFFDYDWDGRPDLYVARYLRFGPGSTQFCSIQGVETACPPEMYPAEKGLLYHNEGARFREVTGSLGLDRTAGRGFGVAAADYDDDGVPDLYVANDTLPCDLFRAGNPFRNRGMASGTSLTERGIAPAGMGVDWGDYDGDGRLDLFVTTFQRQGFALYRNEGSGLFRPTGVETGVFAVTLQRLGFGARFVDVDLDGDLDLVTANGHVQDRAARIDSTADYAQLPTLLLNDRGRFNPATLIRSGDRTMVGRGLATGDWNDDGRSDLLLVDAEGSPRLLLNQAAETRHWLGVMLRARRGDRNGLGAVLRLTAAGRTYLRYSHSDGSYLSASDPRVLFGLGDATRVERLAVRWPSGRQTVHRDLPLDRYVAIEENP